MIPGLSSVPAAAEYAERVNRRPLPLIDFENGGPDLNAGSDSVEFEWKAESDGSTIYVSRSGVAPVAVLADVAITQVSLAFDGTMRPHIAYVASGVAKIYFWDSLLAAYSVLSLPDAASPRCCTDEKDPRYTDKRDIILAYTKANKLCYRQQRDRFATEYVLKNGVNGELVSIGMNQGRRLQFKLRPSLVMLVSGSDDFSSNTIASYTESHDAVGQSWSISSGVMTASASVTSTQSVLRRNDFSSGDVYVEATLNVGIDSGLVARFVDNANYYLMALYDDSTSNAGENVRLYKKVSGTYTLLGSANVTWANGTPQTFRIELVGTSIKCYAAGTLVLSATDSAFTAGAIGLRSNGPSPGTISIFDSLAWGEL